MPLTVETLGCATPPVVHQVDSRWLMAYAASVGALDDVYVNTRRDEGIVGHPLFAVCVEWPAVVAMRDVLSGYGLTREEAGRGVHLSHDLRLSRPVRPGDQLTTTATVVGLTTHRAGILVDLDLVTSDPGGVTVAATRMGTLYRDVELRGPDQIAPQLTPTADQPSNTVDPADPVSVHQVIDGGAAHVYSECSRIWNPIHTDARTAARAGLPGIILHGTATLALAVNHVLRQTSADPTEVWRLQVRFGATVALPSSLDLRVLGYSAPDHTAWFDALGASGTPVLRHGTVVFGPAVSTGADDGGQGVSHA